MLYKLTIIMYQKFAAYTDPVLKKSSLPIKPPSQEGWKKEGPQEFNRKITVYLYYYILEIFALVSNTVN